MDDKYIMRKNFRIHSNIFNLSHLNQKELQDIKEKLWRKIWIENNKGLSEITNFTLPINIPSFSKETYILSLDPLFYRYLSTIAPPLQRIFLTSLGVLSMGHLGYFSSREINKKVLRDEFKKDIILDESISLFIENKNRYSMSNTNYIKDLKEIRRYDKAVNSYEMQDSLGRKQRRDMYRSPNMKKDNSSKINILKKEEKENSYNAISIVSVDLLFTEFLLNLFRYYSANYGGRCDPYNFVNSELRDPYLRTMQTGFVREIGKVREKVRRNSYASTLMYNLAPSFNLFPYFQEYKTKDIDVKNGEEYKKGQIIRFSFVFFIKNIYEYISKDVEIFSDLKINSSFCIFNPFIPFQTSRNLFIEGMNHNDRAVPFVFNHEKDEQDIFSYYRISYFCDSGRINKEIFSKVLNNTIFVKGREIDENEFGFISPDFVDIKNNVHEEAFPLLGQMLRRFVTSVEGRISTEGIIDFNASHNKPKTIVGNMLRGLYRQIDSVSMKSRVISNIFFVLLYVPYDTKTYKKVLFLLIEKLKELEDDPDIEIFTEITTKLIIAFLLSIKQLNQIDHASNAFYGEFNKRYKEAGERVVKASTGIKDLIHKISKVSIDNYPRDKRDHLLAQTTFISIYSHLIFRLLEYTGIDNIEKIIDDIEKGYNKGIKECFAFLNLPVLQTPLSELRTREFELHRFRKLLKPLVNKINSTLEQTEKDLDFGNKVDIGENIGKCYAFKAVSISLLLPRNQRALNILRTMITKKDIIKEEFFKIFNF